MHIYDDLAHAVSDFQPNFAALANEFQAGHAALMVPAQRVEKVMAAVWAAGLQRVFPRAVLPGNPVGDADAEAKAHDQHVRTLENLFG